MSLFKLSSSKNGIALFVLMAFSLMASATTKDNRQIVSEYVEAFNSKNITSMLKYMHNDIKWMNVEGDKISLETNNKQELKQAMADYFKGSGSAEATMSQMLSYGTFVSGIEKVEWLSKEKMKSQCSAVIYQFKEALILNVWYYPAQSCQ